MDVIKIEPDINPLPMQSSDTEEMKPLSEEGKSSDLHATRIKEERVAESYDHTSEIKFEEILLPNNFPVVKCEVEEELCDVDTVKDELKLEVTAEENEILPDSSLNSEENELPEVNCTRTENYLSEDPVIHCSPELQLYEQFFKSNNSVEAQSHSRTDEGSFKCNICGKLLPTLQNHRMHLRNNHTERRFQCDICGKNYLRLKHLKLHIRMHTGEKPFKCSVCGKCYIQSSALSVHSRTHSGEKPFKCEVCGKCFIQMGDLTVHARMHSGERPFKCDACGKCFLRSGHLKEHARTHSGHKPFKCNVCGKCFAQSGHLIAHTRTHSGEKLVKCDVCGKCFANSYTLTIHVHSHSDEKPFKCVVCGKTFSRKDRCNKHVRLHARFEMDAIKTEPEVDPLAVQPCDDTVKEEAYSSPDGRNLFDQHVTGIKTEYVDHGRDLAAEMTFEETAVAYDFPIIKSEAEVREFNEKMSSDMVQVKEEVKQEVMAQENEVLTQSIAFTQNNGLSTYYYSFLEDDGRHADKLYKCSVCDMCFTQSKSLKLHERVHIVDKPFSCDVCGRKFSQTANLESHARIHTGYKPFICDVCGKLFMTSQNLKNHQRSHTGEKPFKCDVCEKRFSRSYVLQIHTRTHSAEKPFKCDVCGKRFSSSKYMQTHTRIHSGEKPFKCDVCGKGFMSLQYLNRHECTHTGEKPFKCDVCGKNFVHLSNLRSHARFHRDRVRLHTDGVSLAREVRIFELSKKSWRRTHHRKHI
ncbi:zinc finger protein 665-like [Periplaneta americana]|uniref:zinc finger protein 665-like n=1 Tax=Periplaneta americana TaxID=6978 RepID=UPI0037E74EF3